MLYRLDSDNFQQAPYEAFSLFHRRWALLTAGPLEDFNTMTISWGALGTVWSRQCLTVYVRSNRYTYEFMERHPEFTVCFFPESFRPDLSLLGAHSGREEDKLALTGLHPRDLAGAVGFAEASASFRCRKLYGQAFDRQLVDEAVRRQYYPLDDSIHHLYIGQILSVEGSLELSDDFAAKCGKSE